MIHLYRLLVPILHLRQSSNLLKAIPRDPLIVSSVQGDPPGVQANPSHSVQVESWLSYVNAGFRVDMSASDACLARHSEIKGSALNDDDKRHYQDSQTAVDALSRGEVELLINYVYALF